LFYLDPHTVQPFVSLSGKDENDESFHCRNPCSMDISELDPSIAVVSLISNSIQFHLLLAVMLYRHPSWHSRNWGLQEEFI